MIPKLIKLEWMKWKGYRPFQVLVILYIIGLPSMLLTLKSFNRVPAEVMSKDIFFVFPSIWQYLGYMGNWLCFFIFGFMGALMITNEVKNKTLRQNIITGLSRREFYLGKLSTIFLVSTLATIYFFLVGFTTGFMHTETIYWAKVWQEISLVFRYWLMTMSYMTIGFFIGTLIKKTGLALFIYLAYTFFLEKLIRYAVHAKIASNKSIHYYPMNATSDLVPFNTPFNNMAEDFLEQNDYSIFLPPTEAVIVTAIYLVLFSGLSYWLLQRRDL